MMRYRRTRASTADGSISKSWSSGVDGPQEQQQQQQPLPPRVTIYQNPSKAGASAGPQQMGTTMAGQSGQMGAAATGGAGGSSGGFLGSGWMTGDRPKSAGRYHSHRWLFLDICSRFFLFVVIYGVLVKLK